MRFDRSGISKCSSCPLNGETKVWSTGPADPKVVIIGEAPGQTESMEGKPFQGPAGWKLRGGLGYVGLMDHRIHLTNVLSCQPPYNNISSMEAMVALECGASLTM